MRDRRAAVQLGKVAHEGEPDSEAGMRARRGRVRLPKPVEDVGQERRRDTAAGVRHADLLVVSTRFDVDVDATALGREANGVGEQVPHDLLQAVRVTRDDARSRIGVHLDADALGARRGPHDLDGGFHHGGQIHRAHLEAQLAGDNPRDVEEVLDELRLRAGVALDDVERLAS